MRSAVKTALVAALLVVAPVVSAQQRAPAPTLTAEQQILSVMHGISSHTLFDHVVEMASEKYGGRLTGTPGYDAAAQWTIGLFRKWGLEPAGDRGTYLQRFPNPYTLVKPGCELKLRVPVANGGFIERPYTLETDYFPGSTSDSGEVTAEVVYVGYGITAPELGFDEYQGVDVKGKIVMVEPEVPVTPDKDQDLFKRWRPYSFHDYKVKNAKEHGAAGMIYDYHIANPNAVFVKGLILTYVGTAVANDLFAATGKKHADVLQQIRTSLEPASFALGATVTIKNVTEHHPEGIGSNVIARIEGSDPVLKNETIIIGAHLDHLGYNPELMPGAHDNASAVAVALGVAEALSKLEVPLQRSVLFILFGAEEQGVKGSEYYVANPVVPNKNVKAFLNLESVGRGERIGAGAGKNYPHLWAYVERANEKYIHRQVTPGQTPNIARPRQDAAHFMWAGIPTLSFGTSGGPRLPYATYHTSKDSPAIITPEIMEDLAQLVFLVTVEMANDRSGS
ncbi:MAG: M28 family peptidase [Vicinamibacterales bacterium]